MNFTSRRNTHPTTMYDQATGRQIPEEEETKRKQETGNRLYSARFTRRTLSHRSPLRQALSPYKAPVAAHGPPSYVPEAQRSGVEKRWPDTWSPFGER